MALILPFLGAAPTAGAVPAPPRYLVAWLPAFRLERCGYQAHDLAALTRFERSTTRLAALTPAAREAGLRAGMSTAEARALAPAVLLDPLDPDAERQDHLDLAHALTTVCDRVAPWEDDAMLLEVSAVAPGPAAEQRLMAQLRDRLAHLGHGCRLAVTDHPRAAAALARNARRDALVPRGHARDALARLPVSALRPSEATLHALTALGLRHIGQLARLDPASLAGRLGADALQLHHVACGLPGEPWAQPAPADALRPLRVDLPDPCAQQAVLCEALTPALQQLQRTLAQRDLALTHLELTLSLDAADPHRVCLHLARPTRCAHALLRLLRARLDALRLPAPVTALHLHPQQLVPFTGHQDPLLRRSATTEPLPELLTRLQGALGPSAIATPTLQPEHHPDAAWTPQPLGVNRPPAAPPAPSRTDPVAPQEATDWHTTPPRPTLLRSPPLPIRVDAPQGIPQALRTERGWQPITHTHGPEHLRGQWWHPSGGYTRVAWVIAGQGATLWVFEERGQWFLWGWFD